MSLLLTAWGLVARLLAFLGLPRWLPLAGIAAAVMLAGAYWKGHHDAAAACQEAALRTKIASLERDIAAANDARNLDLAMSVELEHQRQLLAKEVADYEAALKSKPRPDCALSDADVRALGGLHGKRK